jgi:PST family polysaccharide transporter
MALVSSVLGPMVFFLRNNIIQTLDYSQAGYWETMMRISTLYAFVSTVLTVYFFT